MNLPTRLAFWILSLQDQDELFFWIVHCLGVLNVRNKQQEYAFAMGSGWWGKCRGRL